ncbi:MAG TPA: mandelate racemase/muconate lactonizing enzyme family protein [Chloroflexota bacterium]|nr:mandelate racemase/muconate lactonizing enzyme family protein [Chloroflexota bacterium]
MKMTAVAVQAYRIPIAWRSEPVVAVVARVRTDAGLEGLGPAIPFNALHARSLAVAIEELGELLVGEDPSQPERVHRKLMPGGAGYGGVDNIAVAALDIAVWDLAAQSAGLPLYRALGGYRSRIPVYASLRLSRDLSLAALTETAGALVAQGFTAVKMNIGGDAGLAADVARVRAVREAIGGDVRLLADVNFRWTPAQAIRAGRALEEFDLYWLEDPVPTHNLAGLAEVRGALDVPIAAGEALFGLAALLPLFEARAVDFPMPDLLRVGGITPFLKAAHLAEAFGLPLASHLSPEISAQVVAAVPNGHLVEYNGWAWELFQGCPTLERGELVLSDAPGHGLTLDPAARRHAIA